MDEKKKEINKTIIQLSEEFGEVIPLDEIRKLHPDIKKSNIKKAIDILAEEGIVSYIDKTSISLNE